MRLSTDTLAKGALSLLTFSGAADAFWRMQCPGRLIDARVDPIVNPGVIAGHVHAISGGNGFNYTMDYASTQASTCSSCPIKEDLSNYWVPTLYYTNKDGSFTSVPQAGDGGSNLGGQVVYYLQRGGPKNDNLTAYPKDFRMLAGNPYKRAYTSDFAGQAVSFVCLNYTGSSSYYNKFPDKPCPDGLRAQIFFPSCWDGVNLDSPDHMSHMAYPTQYSYDNGPCPASHPVHMISIFYEIIFSTSSFDWWTPPGTSQPFVFSTGDPTGYGFHGDFVNGWDVQTLQTATNTCLNQSGSIYDCSAFSFFDNNVNTGCIIPPTIEQPVHGNLAKLPGCNPIQYANATKVGSCGDNAVIGPAETYYTNVTGWNYIGCGIDVGSNRTFNDASWWSNSVSVDTCLQYCGTRGYKYAGLEYANQCFCDNNIASDRLPDPRILGNCFTPCAANSSQICGGNDRLSIYQLNGTFQSSPYGRTPTVTCPTWNMTDYISSTGATYEINCGFDRPGGDMGVKVANTSGVISQCIELCASTAGCTYVSMVGTQCYLKGGKTIARTLNGNVNSAWLISSANNSAVVSVSSSSTSTSAVPSNFADPMASAFSSSTQLNSTSTSLSTIVIPSSASTSPTTIQQTSSPVVSVSSSATTPNTPAFTQANSSTVVVASSTVVGADGITTVPFPPTCTAINTNTFAVVDPQSVSYLYMCGGGSAGSAYSIVGTATSWRACFAACNADSKCNGFSYVNGPNFGEGAAQCWLKNNNPMSFTSTNNMLSTRIAAFRRDKGVSTTSTTTVAASTSSFTTVSTINAVATSSSSPTISSSTTLTSSTATISTSTTTLSTLSSSVTTTSTTTLPVTSSTTTLPVTSSTTTTLPVSSSSTSIVSSSTTVTISSSATPLPTTTSSSSSTLQTSTTTSWVPPPGKTSSDFISCPGYNYTYYQSVNTTNLYFITCGSDYSGNDLSMKQVSSFQGCLETCANTNGCVAVSLSGSACYMKKAIGTVQANGGIRGARLVSNSSHPLTTTTSTTSASIPSSTSSSSSAASSAQGISCPASNGATYVDPSTNLKFQVECGIDHAGGDLSNAPANTLADCLSLCASNSACVDASWWSGYCYMKSTLNAASTYSGMQGGKLIQPSAAIVGAPVAAN